LAAVSEDFDKKGDFGINYSLGTVSPRLPLLKQDFILFLG